MSDEVTDAGRELTLQIAPVIVGDKGDATSYALQHQCSEIARLAKRHHRLQEQLCNGFQTAGGDWDERASERAEARDAKLEERIEALVLELPEWEDTASGCEGDAPMRGRFGVLFGGDPRGCTVKLTGPRSAYDSWGGDGVCVPQR